MKSNAYKLSWLRFCSLIAFASSFCEVKAQVSDYPHPVKNTQSRVMLKGDWVPENPHKIDFANLPKVPGEHVVISDVNESKGVNQHNYLVHFNGKFWAMWSDGPGVEDRVGQRVKFATSMDGLKWSTPKFLSPEPPGSGEGTAFYGTRTEKGFRYIARGFWVRNKELLALASLDEAAGFFGKSLELRAFRLNKKNETWEDLGVVFDNTINNFAPEKLPTGQWMMSRRPYDYTTAGVHFIVGGEKKLTDWTSYPVFGTSDELSAEEPNWWLLPDKNVIALFRDNKNSGYIYRSFSSDNGRTWSKPVKTDFPDARSKFSSLRLADGRYVLVSNPNPKKRDPLTISISKDGMVFDKMFYLIGGRHIDYPHVIEHKGYLLVAFSGAKRSVEVIRIKLSDLNNMEMPAGKQ